MTDFNKSIETLQKLDVSKMYGEDFFLTWEKSDDELQGVWAVADALRALRERNISTKVFDSGLGISLFRDNSTRTRFSFASACNLLGLEVQDLDEGKSQIAHGETVRETANMISFMADVIGIRDDMYIGKGNAYMHQVSDAVKEGHEDGVLEQRPTLVNLQCDIDHPTQIMADTAHIIKEFGGVENLKGKKIAMTWAYSPSYGKPLSVPQGAIGLFTRLGMEVVLAHPEGYEVMPEVEEIAKKQAEASGGSFRRTNDMKDAFKDADIVHCLPADITGVSCEEGEVDATVFDRYRIPLYKEASYKPYVIAAMIFLSKFKNPVETLKELERKGTERVQP